MNDTIHLDEKFWDDRYKNEQTGWDIGYPSTPIVEYIDKLKDKSIKILIPGCGNAYEAEYLMDSGFENVYLIDISKTALADFRERNPDFPADHLIHGDFFEHEGQYELIIEQTFFCAILPEERKHYAEKMYELLKPGGKVVGVLFDDPLFDDRPPFGGNALEYIGYFQPVFDHLTIKPCYNSIPERAGRELFINLKKSKNV